MPRYDSKRIEAKWQQFWEQNETFKAPDDLTGEKLYVLDMFPYPSGDGLHVGHPEGYTATDIVCRYSRMRGKHVLHPMGWDAFGLPAEQHAIKTGTHPRTTTYKNIDTFRRQLKMLGFSYDWSREFSTTDPGYYRWTQWIFLQIFNSWYDPGFPWTGPDGKQRIGKGRPISELPIPEDIHNQGDEAVRRYQDRHRLAYQHEAPVNWCPELGTVLSNEEVIDGKSERGSHPVVRLPLRQWMLRITSYADRLLEELDDVNWTESIKTLQRNWIGRSEGAEVDFYVGEQQSTEEPGEKYNEWTAARGQSGFPTEPGDDVLRVYTTRPDTLFGATYMVLAPEHPFVERLTTPQHKDSVEKYCREAAFKSDLDRTDLAKDKSGVFTGSYAVNPINHKPIEIWIADYVLISYGTGAIMAVPGHDERDHAFAQKHELPIKRVVRIEGLSDSFWSFILPLFEDGKHSSAKYIPPNTAAKYGDEIRHQLNQLNDDGSPSDLIRVHETEQDGIYIIVQLPIYTGHTLGLIGIGGDIVNVGLCEPKTDEGIAVNSGDYNGLATADFKKKITGELSSSGLGRGAVNYRLRDWLFSRQHFWGEPFPIWHELDADGNLTGLMRADAEDELPITLPDDFEFKPHGRPDPPLEEAGDDWLFKTDADGTRLKRETNSMPQWAGSCWYYLRFCDPKNEQQFIDPEKEKYWMPVDLYIGGAEHAVLHLLYARFWHKVLFDHGHVSMAEPFLRLVNQGMILGEAELTGYQTTEGNWVSAKSIDTDSFDGNTVQLTADKVEKKGDDFVLKDDPSIVVDSRAYKMSKSRGNVINPDVVVEQYGADSLRMYEMFMGPLEQPGVARPERSD